MIERNFKFYSDIDKLFKKLSIKKELDIDKLNKKEIYYLQYLIDSILYNKEVPITYQSNIISFEFQNIKILCHCQDLGNGKSIIRNFF